MMVNNDGVQEVYGIIEKWTNSLSEPDEFHLSDTLEYIVCAKTFP